MALLHDLKHLPARCTASSGGHFPNNIFLNWFSYGTLWSNACRIHLVWPDLAIFCHFGKVLKVFGQFLDGLFSIWINFVPTLACYATGQIVIVVNGQRSNNKQSHLVTLDSPLQTKSFQTLLTTLCFR